MFLLYVGYQKAVAAEFSTQEQGRKWCMDNSLFRSSGTSSESTQLNQYCSKLSHVPLRTSVLHCWEAAESEAVHFRHLPEMMLVIKNSTTPCVYE